MIDKETPLAKIVGQMLLSRNRVVKNPSGDVPAHKRALTSGNTAQSAVAEHAAEQSHVINWNEAKVMACHPHYCQRCALEAWHIRTEAQTMNRDAGPLPSVYDPLIHQSHP